jgi:hypothetical protein
MDILLEVETDHLAFPDLSDLRQEIGRRLPELRVRMTVHHERTRRLFAVRQHTRRRDRRVSERDTPKHLAEEILSSESTTATTMYREMDMRFRREQAEAEMSALA